MRPFTYSIRLPFIFFVLLATSLVTACGGGTGSSPAGGLVDPQLQRVLQTAKPSDPIKVIVYLTDGTDTSQIKDLDIAVRRQKIVTALRDKASIAHAPVMVHLRGIAAKRVTQLWIANAVAATVRADQISQLATLPGVRTVVLDAEIPWPIVPSGTIVSAGSSTGPAWNLTAINAQSLWTLGYNGQGVVVANMDTGVLRTHETLSASYRGGVNSWKDVSVENYATPTDIDGHGTRTMGLMVGGNMVSTGTPIGVAPGAKWIAVKVAYKAQVGGTFVTRFDLSSVHAAFQWLLDPDGNPNTNDAPDVVNASWTLSTLGCDAQLQFLADIQALRAASIAIVFAGGNFAQQAAPNDPSPSNYAESFSVGSVDYTNAIDPVSSVGPSSCTGNIFPNVVAPGVSVVAPDKTAVNHYYLTTGGTSYAAPHVAGTMALLLSAFPGQTVPMLETALKQTALDLGTAGPDNTYGYGLIDALKAYQFLKRAPLDVFVNGSWFVDLNGNGIWDGTPIDAIYNFGTGFTGAIPLLGDWTGTLTKKIGIYSGGMWYLDLNGNSIWDGTPADGIFNFGVGFAGAVPVVGHWTGNASEKIGVYSNGMWYLDLNGNGVWDNAPTDGIFNFGVGFAGAVPVVGDWTGTGIDKIGIYSSGMWYLDLNGNGVWDNAPTDGIFNFGVGFAGAVPVVGDWTGTGKKKIGVYVDGMWYLDLNGNGVWDGTPTDAIYNFGVGFPGAVPVVGDWTGTHQDKIGVYVNGMWYRDLNGNGIWDGTSVDAISNFGVGFTGAIPVIPM